MERERGEIQQRTVQIAAIASTFVSPTSSPTCFAVFVRGSVVCPGVLSGIHPARAKERNNRGKKACAR